MSSTGRGPRMGGPEDFFVTPSWTVRRLLETYKPRGGLWLEPGAGNGAIIRAVNAVRKDVQWIAAEIREEERAALQPLCSEVLIGDYLTDGTAEWRARCAQVAVAVGNPPFTLAHEFLMRTRELCPMADIALQLRLNFVGSEDRAAFMRQFPPDAKTLPNRPSYFLRTTDSPEYSWLIWPPGERAAGTFQVLASTSIAERQRDMPQVGKCPACGGLGGVINGHYVPRKTPLADPCPRCLGFGKVKTGPSEVEKEWGIAA